MYSNVITMKTIITSKILTQIMFQWEPYTAVDHRKQTIIIHVLYIFSRYSGICLGVHVVFR